MVQESLHALKFQDGTRALQMTAPPAGIITASTNRTKSLFTWGGRMRSNELAYVDKDLLCVIYVRVEVDSVRGNAHAGTSFTQR
jgi:hypothetical protein